MADDSSSEDDISIGQFNKQTPRRPLKKSPISSPSSTEDQDNVTITFRQRLILTSAFLGVHLIAKRVIMLSFSTLNEELINRFILCVLFAINVIIYVRGKSNSSIRSHDKNEEEDTDWPPEELIFEYTPKHAKGKKSIPEDVIYARFHSDIIEMEESAWLNDGSTFKDHEHLEMVVLNEGLRNIGKRTFERCELLQRITFPSTLIEVGPNAFRSSGLVNVELNDGLECIDWGAFVNCKSLKSIKVPSTLRHIGETAFYGCSSLKEIVLNEGLTKVDDSVFEGCISLKSIKFPSSIREIGANAFDHSSPFWNRSDLKEVVFNDGLLKIGDAAFIECKSLSSIVVPSSVTYLGERAFYYCIKLRKVVFNEAKTIDKGKQEGLKEVGVASFSYCSSLETIEFPSTLTKICDKAFKGCGELKEVTISDGSNLKMIGKNVFDDCDSLESIKITFPRLEYIIEAGHANITNEINEIPDIQCITKQQHWMCKLLGRKNSTEVLITGGRWNEALRQVGQIKKLIKHYEIKEATVLFELALWKSKMEQAGDAVDDSSNRGGYHIEIPGPVKEAILQYICPAKEAYEHRR